MDFYQDFFVDITVQCSNCDEKADEFHSLDEAQRWMDQHNCPEEV